jgi:hypothetical protein
MLQNEMCISLTVYDVIFHITFINTITLKDWIVFFFGAFIYNLSKPCYNLVSASLCGLHQALFDANSLVLVIFHNAKSK